MNCEIQLTHHEAVVQRLCAGALRALRELARDLTGLVPCGPSVLPSNNSFCPWVDSLWAPGEYQLAFGRIRRARFVFFLFFPPPTPSVLVRCALCCPIVIVPWSALDVIAIGTLSSPHQTDES